MTIKLFGKALETGNYYVVEILRNGKELAVTPKFPLQSQALDAMNRMKKSGGNFEVRLAA